MTEDEERLAPRIREERVIENELAFRGINDRIREAAVRYGDTDPDAVSFICECADGGCVEQIVLSLDDYRLLRTYTRRFAMCDGHEEPEFETVVERRQGYIVAEKDKEPA
jgi:hypothetical protein